MNDDMRNQANGDLNGTMTMTGTAVGNYFSPSVWPYQQDGTWWPLVYTSDEPPRECSGDVHVFPCPHCETCECGKATLHRGKK